MKIRERCVGRRVSGEWAGRREEDEGDSDQSTLYTCKIVNK